MSRLALVDPTDTTGAARDIIDRVERSFGRVPNAIRVLANSSTALQAWWAFERAFDRSALPPSLREQLALSTAGANGCSYCVGLHSAIAGRLGVGDDDIAAAIDGGSSDPTAAAVLRFARAAQATNGAVLDADLDEARAAGLDDGRLVEILAVVAINTFNNACNRLAETPPDTAGDTDHGEHHPHAASGP